MHRYILLLPKLGDMFTVCKLRLTAQLIAMCVCVYWERDGRGGSGGGGGRRVRSAVQFR